MAEAASEYGHLEVRRHLWGYVPKENLPISELLKGHFQGIRPAVGYPCLPDQSLNFLLAELLDFPSLGITLTESAAMLPHASVSGLLTLLHDILRLEPLARISCRTTKSVGIGRPAH